VRERATFVGYRWLSLFSAKLGIGHVIGEKEGYVEARLLVHDAYVSSALESVQPRMDQHVRISDWGVRKFFRYLGLLLAEFELEIAGTRGRAPSAWRILAITQNPVKANIRRLMPTSPVRRRNQGLTSQASTVPADVKDPATSQMIRSRYQESVRARYIMFFLSLVEF
jgi:hypothetical protein